MSLSLKLTQLAITTQVQRAGHKKETTFELAMKEVNHRKYMSQKKQRSVAYNKSSS